VRHESIQEVLEPGIIQFLDDFFHRGRTVERRAGKRRLSGVTHLMRKTVFLQLVDDAVQHRHFPIQIVERTQPEVAMPLEFTNGGILLVAALHQSIHRRR